MKQFVFDWPKVQFLLTLLTGIIISLVFKIFDFHIKKKEVRYSLWYKSKLELLLSYNAAYLVALSQLKRMHTLSKDNSKNDERIDRLREYLIELEIKSFSLESYVTKSEGEKISKILEAFNKFEEKLSQLNMLSDMEWITLLTVIEVNASELQPEIRDNFLSKE